MQISGATPTPTFDVAIIGSGMGGSAAAAILAHAGQSVVVLEKNPRVGGSCSWYERDGFRIDIGTHLFCRAEKGPLGDVLRRVGRPEAVHYKRVAPMKVRGAGLRLHYPRSPLLMLPVGLIAMRQAGIPLSQIPPVMRMFATIMAMSEREMDDLDRRHVSVHDFVTRYTTHPYVYIGLNFLLGLYFILPPKDVSAGEAIYCFKTMLTDMSLSYPMGGASAIPRAFLDAATDHGAVVETKARAEQIVLENGRVTGVRTHDGRLFNARHVIATGSLRDTMNKLVGAEHFSPKFRERVNTLKGSQIAVQVKVGLRRPLVKAACLVGGTPMFFPPGKPTLNTLTDNFDAFYAGRIPEITPVYCPIPTFFDPLLAPPGTQLLTACALAPTRDIDLVDDHQVWVDALLNALREMVPGWEKEQIFCDTFDVPFIESWIGKTGGAAVTTAQTMGQVGADRPGVRSEIPGLWFAGDCAGARGVGTELATASGMLCADTLLDELKRRAA